MPFKREPKYIYPHTKPFPALFGLINPIPFFHESQTTTTGIPILSEHPGLFPHKNKNPNPTSESINAKFHEIILHSSQN